MKNNIFTRHDKQSGFTVVEIAVVIVVVAILATVVAVGYNATVRNSHAQAVSADLSATASQLAKFKTESGSYPTTAQFNALEKNDSNGNTTYQYTVNIPSNVYCITATYQNITYHLDSATRQPTEGAC